jgi:hypothetical protein
MRRIVIACMPAIRQAIACPLATISPEHIQFHESIFERLGVCN